MARERPTEERATPRGFARMDRAKQREIADQKPQLFFTRTPTNHKANPVKQAP